MFVLLMSYDRIALLLIAFINKHKALKLSSSKALCGGDKRARTADLLNAIQALSQLSYTPILFAEQIIAYLFLLCKPKF